MKVRNGDVPNILIESQSSPIPLPPGLGACVSLASQEAVLDEAVQWVDLALQRFVPPEHKCNS